MSQQDYSPEYPLSGMCELYDIWREAQLMNETMVGKSKQQQAYKGKCPECSSELHEVLSPDEDEETGYQETYLWCNGCLVSIDEDGGYTK